MWTAVLRPCLVSLALLLASIAIGCAPGVIGGGDQPQQVDDGSGAPPPDDSESPSGDDGLDDEPPPDDPVRGPAVWRHAFDASSSGALSAVWGNSPDDVFVVGGTPEQGEIYHYDGDVWRTMRVPPVPLLVWVYGFGSDDVYAVGVGGGAVHFDGSTWTALNSGTDEDLWGVWGQAPDDIWIVGGNARQGDPVLLHYDGSEFTVRAAPDNDRNAASLFKVWGIGSKVFAVGENGLIIQYENDEWFQVPAGPDADEDFVSLWGTSEDHIVAVGGRSGARIAVYDGENWTTSKIAGVPGLNAVCMEEPDEAVVGGVDGYVGSYNPFTNTLTAESSDTNLTVHGGWADGSGRCYSVGGRFATPYVGVALVRTFGDPGFETAFPLDAPSECVVDAECDFLDGPCTDGQCNASVCEAVPINEGGDCADADVCNGDETCQSGICTNGPELDCDDSNACTTDTCGPVTGCDNDGMGITVTCDDDDACTTGDACQGDPAGTCAGTDTSDVDCDDGIACTTDTCDPATGCDNARDNAACDDSNVCTMDTCDTALGCLNDGTGITVACDDGDACTTSDSCSGGVCVGEAPPICDDGNQCTDDTCNPGSGCVFTNDDTNSCDNGNPVDDPDTCTAGVCLGTGGCLDDDANCDDQNVCTTDVCLPSGDCDHTNNSNSCDDNNACTTSDSCSGGVCVGSAPPNCDDGNVCTVDTCHPVTGCDKDGAGITISCNDDDACTTDDVCQGDAAGTCSGTFADSDGDGTCDADDICPGSDDSIDSDNDGVPDGCDPCPDDNPDDSDGDGVCNSADICPGHDDKIDSDGNGIPDGCCEAEPHCLLGEACIAGVCRAVSEDIELGLGNPYVKILAGGEMPVTRGFQGFTEIRLSYRTLDFTSGGDHTVTVGIVMADDNTLVLSGTPRQLRFADIGSGINEYTNHYLVSFVDPVPLYGRQAIVSLTITDDIDPAISVSIEQTVVIVNANGR